METARATTTEMLSRFNHNNNNNHDNYNYVYL